MLLFTNISMDVKLILNNLSKILDTKMSSYLFTDTSVALFVAVFIGRAKTAPNKDTEASLNNMKSLLVFLNKSLE